ncbi:MAG: hypothetical protein OEY14_11390 [Myxococcales bacterium]|nr:hypothetical protein [Myxococcales bacterium]
MSSAAQDNYYDLREAGTLSARLRSAATRAKPSLVTSAPQGYVQFSLSRLVYGVDEPSPGASAPALAELSTPIPSSDEMAGSAGWGRMLEWAVEALDASSAFLVDARGLVVGCEGVLGSDLIDETAARLVVAFEQADLMLGGRGGARSVLIELEIAWLVGLRIPFEPYGQLIVAVVSAQLLSAAAREELTAVFERKARDS